MHLEIKSQKMGYKKVCLECRIVLNRDIDLGSELTYPCPECAKPMTNNYNQTTNCNL